MLALWLDCFTVNEGDLPKTFLGFKDQMKKLSKQKRCYEEIIAYFKQEMGLMADQLNNLQELLVSKKPKKKTG